MVRVISFALWGNDKTYTIGAIKNAELALLFYPDFECWFYIHKESVPIETIEALYNIKNVKIIFKTGDLKHCKPMCWRFEPIDDTAVEIMMSRDTDTRILLREKLAVDEWLLSGKLFHIMRDHPHHYNLSYRINAGMFGINKSKYKDNKIKKYRWLENINSINNIGKFTDQLFLNDHIYPMIVNDCLVHTSFQIYPIENSKRFPISYDNEYRFVGEYVYHDESRSQHHIDSLKKGLKN